MCRRSSSSLLACGVLLGALLLGGCGGPKGLYVQGPAIQPSPVSGPVYVADALGQPLQRPTSVGLSDSVGLSGLRWGDWGGAKATASGRLSGGWCAPGCGREPYDVTVVLSGLEKQERVPYYRRATVVPEQPEELPAAAEKVQLQGIRLSVPAF
ncbi:hypothetical protein [Streptomyces cavernicola]|uniref:Lipoprotein n=1 Tax=Streptomyces cavernicola TaxID=3043613 RepID=A0ABT6S5V7_9ACTN|nr:hypothetical protein [Streptomyces sp. B-S-A6]MDI3403465.1 hypothetical protein [Streptomyces sp. B-S-A6]